MKSQSQIAASLATIAHKDQFRRDGKTPYLNHPIAVADKLTSESDEVIAVAFLHDAAEDAGMTEGDFRVAGLRQTVIEAIQTLTHKDGESYEDYLKRVKANPIALKVKIADMLHNLSDQPTKNQIIKYSKGLLYLLS